MRNSFTLFIFFFLIGPSKLFSQTGPLYNHFFLNQFVFNPAYVGNDDAMILDLNQRMQWTSIEGAPQTSTLTFQTPINYSWSFGANIYTDKRSIFTSSAASLGAGYKIGFGDGNSFLRFGLAAKINLQALDLSDLGPTADPVFLNAEINSLRTDALFGIQLHAGDFNLGLSLPSLFNPQLVSTESFVSPALDPLKNINGMLSYKFELSPGKVTLEPHFIYHLNDSFPDQFEAAAVFNINEVLNVGGGYRQDYGLTAFAGLSFSKKYYVGYGYEPGGEVVSNALGGTHEIHLRIKLKDKKQKKATSTQDILDQMRLKDKGDLHKSRFRNLSEEEQYQLLKSEAVTSYQVAVKFFDTFKAADSFSERLRKQKLDANVEYEKASKKFYVFLYQTENSRKASQLRAKLAKNRLYKEARVIKTTN